MPTTVGREAGSLRGERMPHAVLLGDSIFDNARYAAPGGSVSEHLTRALGQTWQLTTLAVDGHYIADVHHQLTGLPTDTSALAVSVGGNDGIRYAQQLDQLTSAGGDFPQFLTSMYADF